MPDDPHAPRLDFAALDLSRSRLRVYRDGRVARMPAAVFGDQAGALSFGDEAMRRGLADPAGLEPAVPDWVDDEHLALSAELHRVGDLLRELLRHALLALRPAPPEESAPRGLLVLSVPGYWGGPRRGVVERCADELRSAGLADRVEIVSSTAAILAGAMADADGLDLRKVVVVEREDDRLLACVVADPARLLPPEGGGPAPRMALLDGLARDVDVDPATLGDLVVRAAGPGLPASAVLFAPRGGPTPRADVWRAAPRQVRVLDADCGLRGAVELARAMAMRR